MFFAISRLPQDSFTQSWQLGNVYLSTDDGWSQHIAGSKTFVFKGYADSVKLSDSLAEVTKSRRPTHSGNFCVIVYDTHNQEIRIHTDLYRSFPLYITPGQIVTNLRPGLSNVWADNVAAIDQELQITQTKFDIYGDILTDTLTFKQAVDCIDQILSNKTQSFLRHNTTPIKAHLSGGVDSLLVFSYLQKFSDSYELVRCQHFDYDRFWVLNEGQIKKFWGYRQLHHWREPTVLTSGAPGDEFMLRSPTTSNLFLLYHNTNVIRELGKRPDSLHGYYFKLDKHQEIFKNQVPLAVTGKTDLIRQLCNTVSNDHQHWHLGNTLTWTPLRDLEIFKTILRMPVTDCVDQILDSKLSKALIERNMPGGTALISDQKNNLTPMKNLVNFLFK